MPAPQGRRTHRMRLKSEGLSHRLKKCPPDTFLPSLRSGRPFESLPTKTKFQIPKWVSGILVRRKGLELMVSLRRAVATDCPPDSQIDLFESLLRDKINPNPKTRFGLFFFGTPEGTRPPNPRNRNPMLYPLSHRRISLQPEYYNSFYFICKGVFYKKFYCQEGLFML